MENVFFDNWESMIRTACLTILGYISMVIFLRISGKRTLSKMNAFDFVITIALGSCLATLSLNKNVSLADGILAFFLLIFLQFVLTWLSVRISAVKHMITSRPALIFYKGEFLYEVMKKERISMEEIYNAGRLKGLSSLDDIEIIVLETTGDISIIEKKIQKTLDTTENIDFKKTKEV